jgi:hypothetical protein
LFFLSVLFLKTPYAQQQPIERAGVSFLGSAFEVSCWLGVADFASRAFAICLAKVKWRLKKSWKAHR